MKNYGWSNRVVENILKTNTFELAINPVRTVENETEFVDLLEVLLTEYQKATRRIIQTQMMANMFYQFGHSNNYKVLVNRFNSLWPLQEVREIIKKTMFANKFFDFWYIHLLNRTSDNNLRTLMRTMLSHDILIKAEVSQFWLFKHYYPGDPKLREVITQKLMRTWESKNSEGQLLVLSVMENSILKRDMAKLDNYFDKPLFQIKRDYYKKSLKNKKLSEFAVYQLTNLGDTKMENIWQAIQ